MSFRFERIICGCWFHPVRLPADLNFERPEPERLIQDQFSVLMEYEWPAINEQR